MTQWIHIKIKCPIIGHFIESQNLGKSLLQLNFMKSIMFFFNMLRMVCGMSAKEYYADIKDITDQLRRRRVPHQPARQLVGLYLSQYHQIASRHRYESARHVQSRQAGN